MEFITNKEQQMPYLPPPRVTDPAAVRDRAKRHVAASTVAVGLMATVGLGGLVGVMAQQAAVISAAKATAQTSSTATSTPTPTTAATSTPTTTPAASSTGSSATVSASTSTAQVKTGGS